MRLKRMDCERTVCAGLRDEMRTNCLYQCISQDCFNEVYAHDHVSVASLSSPCVSNPAPAPANRDPDDCLDPLMPLLEHAGSQSHRLPGHVPCPDSRSDLMGLPPTAATSWADSQRLRTPNGP